MRDGIESEYPSIVFLSIVANRMHNLLKIFKDACNKLLIYNVFLFVFVCVMGG